MHVRLKTLLLLVWPLLLVVAAAYVPWSTGGLPVLPGSHTMASETAAEPYGFRPGSASPTIIGPTFATSPLLNQSRSSF